MTRINCIPVQELVNKHLIAEYRELPRIFNLTRMAQNRNELPYDYRNPKFYTLGKGHVRFFYNKLLYCQKRQAELICEMKNRNFKISFENSEQLLHGIDKVWINDWIPSENDMIINRNRINERLKINTTQY